MRNTIQNDLILNIVENSNEHCTAEEVYKKCLKFIPNISLGTVYRNLNRLVDLNKIKRIKMPDNIDRFDKNLKHAHIICNNCKSIDDVYDDLLKKTPVINNFVINDYDLIFYGICKKCIEKDG